MEKTIKIDGQCHCGAIAYEAEIDPGRVRICRCTDCQVLSGTAFRITAPTAEADFRLLRGTPAEYRKTAESGRIRAPAFCRNCGSPPKATSAGEGPRVFGIRGRTIRQRRGLVPKRRIGGAPRFRGCRKSPARRSSRPSDIEVSSRVEIC